MTTSHRISVAASVVFFTACLGACADPEPEDSLGVAASELVINPTLGGPWGSLPTCAAVPIVVGPGASVPERVVSLLDNAAANWGHTYRTGTYAASSTGSDGLGASKWYPGRDRNAKNLLVYWNNATQCAYALPATATSCLGTSCTAEGNDTSPQLYRKYAALSLEDGILGLPISNPVQFRSSTVTYQLFTNGVITYHAHYGAHYVGGPASDERALARAWMRAFGVTTSAGPPGYPLMEDPRCTNLQPAPGNCTNDAGKNGRYVKVLDVPANLPGYLLARTGWTQGYAIWGRFAAKWMSVHGSQPWNIDGFPIQDPKTAPSGEQFVALERGMLVSATTPDQAVLVSGAMFEYVTSTGRADLLGVPTGDEGPIGDGGRVQSFRNANVYKRPDGQIVAVGGGAKNPTLATYLAAGGPSGPWGFAREDAPALGTQLVGRYRGQRFDRGLFVPTGDTVGDWYPDGGGWPGLSFDLHIGQTGPSYTDLHWTNAVGAVTSRTLLRSYDDVNYTPIMSLPGSASMASDNPATAIQHGFTVRPEERFVCYYLQVNHLDGRVSRTNAVCQYTPGPRVRDVGRLTIAIRTSTKSDAQTNHRVRVMLQRDPAQINRPGPYGNATWLDTPVVNFGRGTTSSFDLSTSNIRDLADITQLVIEVDGDDAFCVAGVELLANNVQVFSKEYGEDNCQWTENARSYGGRGIRVADHDELRAYHLWQQYNTTTTSPPFYPPVVGTVGSKSFRFIGFKKDEFISKLNSMVADEMLAKGSDPSGDTSYPRFDPNPTQTLPVPGFGDDTLQVIQSVQANDGWYGDVHCELQYQLKIVPEFDGAQGWIDTRIEIPPATAFSVCWTDGWSNYIPLWNLIFAVAPAMIAEADFDAAFDEFDPPKLGTLPGEGHWCFVGPNGASIFGAASMGPQSFTVCVGRPTPP